MSTDKNEASGRSFHSVEATLSGLYCLPERCDIWECAGTEHVDPTNLSDVRTGMTVEGGSESSLDGAGARPQ